MRSYWLNKSFIIERLLIGFNNIIVLNIIKIDVYLEYLVVIERIH